MDSNVENPNSLGFAEFISFLESAGYNRILVGGKYQRLSLLKNSENELNQCFVVIDKIKVNNKNRSRIAAAISNALESGKGFGEIRCEKGNLLESLILGLRSKKDGKLFESPTPNLFSFNSPQGACPHCRGFGRTISIDKQSYSKHKPYDFPKCCSCILRKVFRHCQEDLIDYCKTGKLDHDKPVESFSSKELQLLWKETQIMKKVIPLGMA